MKKSHTHWRAMLLLHFALFISILSISIGTSAEKHFDLKSEVVPSPSPVQLRDAGVDDTVDMGDNWEDMSDAGVDMGDAGLVPVVHHNPHPRGSKAQLMQLALARICVAEAGFQVRTRDCELIYHVFRTRSNTGDLTLGIMRSYSPRSFDAERTDRRKWIAHLNHNFTEPFGWKDATHLPWVARKEGFQRVYEFAGDIIRRRPSNPCNDRLDHWGARNFRRQAHLEDGWRIVQCGETKNTFWALPNRLIPRRLRASVK